MNTQTRTPKQAIPNAVNLVLLLALTAVQTSFLMAPALLHLDRWDLLLPMLLLFATTAYSYWALIHEAIHGIFTTHAQMNRWAGRLMSIVHGCPFAVVRVAHLLHHKYNRVEDFAEVYDPSKTTRMAATARHYFVLLVGRYVSEVLVNFIVWLPRAKRSAIIPKLVTGYKTGRQIVSTLEGSRILNETRVDSILCVSLFGVSAFAYQGMWGTFCLVHIARAVVISVLDDAYHYGTAKNHDDHPEPARNHALFCSWVILHFNLHGIHHRYPTASWITLPRLAKHDHVVPDGGYFRSVLRQLKGPIAEADLPCQNAHQLGLNQVPAKN